MALGLSPEEMLTRQSLRVYRQAALKLRQAFEAGPIPVAVYNEVVRELIDVQIFAQEILDEVEL